MIFFVKAIFATMQYTSSSSFLSASGVTYGVHAETRLLTFAQFKFLQDKIGPFVSSIFLRRLLHPGVHRYDVLRSTLLDYNRHWTDTEFRSLTVEGLKKEIRSVIENQAFPFASSFNHSFNYFQNLFVCVLFLETLFLAFWRE